MGDLTFNIEEGVKKFREWRPDGEIFSNL